MPAPSRKLFAAAFVLVAAPALADERDDRIDKLERETTELRKELAAIRAERGAPSDVSVSAVRAAVDEYLSKSAAASGWYVGPGGVRRPAGDVKLGGYFSTRYVATEIEGAKPSFVDMRLVPQIHADITNQIAFNTEVEIEHGGISDEVEGEIVVEYAELSFRASDAFTFKVGTLLVPFGWFNMNHDDPLNELSSRPDVARWIVPSAFDVPGMGAEGAFDLNKDTSLTYDAIICNGFSDNINSEEGTRAARTLFEEDDNHDKTVFGRVGIVPTLSFLDALNAGISGAFGKIGEQSDRLRGFGADAAAKHGPWEFKGEYAQFGIDRERGAAPPIDAAGNLGPVRNLHGWYAQILYRFTEAWVRGLPFAKNDASVALVLRRDAANLNDQVHGASDRDDEHAWTIGVNYRPTTKTVVKLEFRHAESGAAGSLGSDRDFFALEFATYF